MAKITGFCKNIDEECQYCMDRTPQSKEKSEPFVCEGCGKPLFLPTGGNGGGTDGNGNPLKIIIIVASVLAVAGICFGIWRFGFKDKNEQVITPDSITLDKTSLSFENPGTGKQLTATIFPADVSEKSKKVIWKSDNEAVAKVDSTGFVTSVASGKAVITVITVDGGKTATCTISVNGTRTKFYPFGKYTGSFKNGIPEGDGKMTYSRRVQIAKHDTENQPHYADPGDYFIGSWGNGDIVTGRLYKSNGKTELIRAPKRFNPYDISKD